MISMTIFEDQNMYSACRDEILAKHLLETTAGLRVIEPLDKFGRQIILQLGNRREFIDAYLPKHEIVTRVIHAIQKLTEIRVEVIEPLMIEIKEQQ